MNDCRRGDRTSYYGISQKNIKVEVGVEIGLIINLEVEHLKDKITKEDFKNQLIEKLTDIFHIDGKDKVLNNIFVYNVQ